MGKMFIVAGLFLLLLNKFCAILWESVTMLLCVSWKASVYICLGQTSTRTFRMLMESCTRLWVKKRTASAGNGWSSLSWSDNKSVAICSNFQGLHTHTHTQFINPSVLLLLHALTPGKTYRSLSSRQSRRSLTSFSYFLFTQQQVLVPHKLRHTTVWRLSDPHRAVTTFRILWRCIPSFSSSTVGRTSGQGVGLLDCAIWLATSTHPSLNCKWEVGHAVDEDSWPAKE